MPTQQDISQQMIQALGVSFPGLDTTIGSPVRSILDVVAESIAESSADQYLMNYGFNLAAMSGATLDNFVANFGFTRLPAKRAMGTITFSRVSEATSDILIPAATQVSTNSTPPVIFNTLTPVVLSAATTSCSVPIQAQVGGTSGNVAANTLTAVTSNQMGFSSVTNPSSCTGGTDAESDDQLRARFQATVFRSLAGTVPMLTGVALDDPDVSQVNVIGSTKTYTETIQIIGGTATSSVQDFAYLYPQTCTLATNFFSGTGFTYGSQYTLTSSPLSAPTISSITQSVAGSGFANGTTVVYAIVARDAAGETLPGSTSTHVTTSANSVLTVAWGAVPGAVSYDVYR